MSNIYLSIFFYINIIKLEKQFCDTNGEVSGTLWPLGDIYALMWIHSLKFFYVYLFWRDKDRDRA